MIVIEKQIKNLEKIWNTFTTSDTFRCFWIKNYLIKRLFLEYKYLIFLTYILFAKQPVSVPKPDSSIANWLVAKVLRVFWQKNYAD